MTQAVYLIWFMLDTLLIMQVNPKVYSDSKYDRGHMAPAADFAGDPNIYKETFTMANISPQVVSCICSALNLINLRVLH